MLDGALTEWRRCGSAVSGSHSVAVLCSQPKSSSVSCVGGVCPSNPVSACGRSPSATMRKACKCTGCLNRISCTERGVVFGRSVSANSSETVVIAALSASAERVAPHVVAPTTTFLQIDLRCAGHPIGMPSISAPD